MKKKHSQRTYRKARAAVSIFLIIVLFSTILLGGLFIDATRILMAKRAVRNAANSAARSALSYYDKNLSGEYGLFGVKASIAEEAFRHYFKTNIALSQNDGFNILKMDVQDSNISVSASSPLTDTNTMLREMGDYSKYRAVVDTLVVITQKFTQAFQKGGKVFNASDTAKDGLEQLKNDFTECSNRARFILSSTLTSTKKRVKESLSGLMSNGHQVSEKDLGFDELSSNIDAAQAKNDELKESEETYREIDRTESANLDALGVEPIETWDEDSGTYRSFTPDSSVEETPNDNSETDKIYQQTDAEISAVQQEIDDTRSRLNEKMGQIRTKTTQVNQKNTEIQELTNKIDQQTGVVNLAKAAKRDLENKKANDPYNFLFGDDLNGDISGLGQKLDKLQAELDKLKAENADAERIKAAQQNVTAMEYRIKFEKACKAVTDAEKNGATARELEQLRNQRYKATEDMKKYYKSIGRELKTPYDDQIKAAGDAVTSAQQVLDSYIKQKSDREKEIKTLITEIEKLYDEIPAGESVAGQFVMPSLKDGEKEQATSDGLSFLSELFSSAQKYYYEFGKSASDVTIGTKNFSLDSLSSLFGIEALVGDVLGTVETLKDLFQGLNELFNNHQTLLDAYLFTSYVYETHTFLTSQTARSHRHFQLGELEYIIEGDDLQIRCIVKTLYNIAKLRLLINWVNYMVTTHAPIISRIVIAFGRAAIRTLKDMFDLVFTLDGKKSTGCGLCPSFDNIKVTYSDHLWLWIMFRSINSNTRTKMLNNLQKMMKDTYQVNSWGNPDELQTAISADVTVDVDLIMLTLPMFEAVLPPDNQILKDGKFQVHESVYLNY